MLRYGVAHNWGKEHKEQISLFIVGLHKASLSDGEINLKMVNSEMEVV